VNLSDTAANAQAAALGALCNGGTLRLFSGPQPVNANTALSGNTLLATLGMSSTAFGEPGGGVMVANPITPAVAGATGTATFARFYASDGLTVVMDATVGTMDATLVLNTVAIVQGSTVAVSAYTHTVQET